MSNTILYIHGLGGGGDSRIPGLLAEKLPMKVVVRTYDFDPRKASSQISSWAEELQPDIIIGESMGSCHALVLAAETGRPCVLISPAINAPRLLAGLAWAVKIPGMRRFLNRKYKPAEGDRQTIDFKYDVLRAYGPLYVKAMGFSGCCHAFFGRRDGFRRSGVVSLRTFKRRFPDSSFSIYDGSHYMEENNIDSLLVPYLRKFL